MDIDNIDIEPKEKKKKAPSPKEEKEPNVLGMGEDDFDYDDEDDEEDDLDSSSDTGEDKEPSNINKKHIIIGAGIVVVLIGIILFFVLGGEEEQAVIEEPVVEEKVDSLTEMQDSLYKKGIGKEAVDEKKIYDQGPLSGKDFRKDFTNIDSPESYEMPIKIAAVNDSVSYTKHRTMTDDGMDMYWVDAQYKSKKTRLTLPYYIWQTLSPQGVMDVIVETVTDKGGKTFVTSITAVPPNKQEGEDEE